MSVIRAIFYWTACIAVLLWLWACAGCAAVDRHSLSHTLSNWRVEAEMYSIEWANGLPTGHSHTADGSPYETWK